MREHVKLDEIINIMDKCNECKQASRKMNFGCEKIMTCLILKK